MFTSAPDGYDLVFSAKGGAGKTTLARELAVAASLAGRQTAMVDLDPQHGLTGWYGRRAQETPVLVEARQVEEPAELVSQGS